ncbi:MAG: RNA methyltransferase [Flavobacteriaceae bacterium]|nr:RNA methyltransferase [Flavobacteriaceae bacterium]
MKKLISVNNEDVKNYYQLTLKSKARKKNSIFLIEGLREINLAISNNYKIVKLLFCPQIIDLNVLQKKIYDSIEKTEISIEVYRKLAYRNSTEGIIALSEFKNHNLSEISLKSNNPLIVVIEAPEKPGNIGALLRTSDAANVDAVIIANPKTDLYNPNIIRSSVGSLFTNSIYTGSTSSIIKYLKENNIQIITSSLNASKIYSNQSFLNRCAIILGTEDKGLTNEWIESSDNNIIIPMHGKIDSLNLSIAAAILIFEAKRQRNLY